MAAEPTRYFPLFAYHREVKVSYSILPILQVVDTVRLFEARARTGLAAFQQFLNLRKSDVRLTKFADSGCDQVNSCTICQRGRSVKCSVGVRWIAGEMGSVAKNFRLHEILRRQMTLKLN
jgi:hypothetical protein